MRKKAQAAIWAAGLVFLLLFSYMTSPLFPYAHGWDSAFFQLVGAGMTKGLLPYRDFFDMKGPWLFFFQYIGQLLCYGKTGVFLVQCVNMGVVLWLLGKIYAKYYQGSGIWHNLLVLVPFGILLAATMEGGNLTEEWSLAFLFFPLYLSMEFFAEEKRHHKAGYAFWYGLSFGVLALIRITNAVLLCAVVFAVAACLAAMGQWKNLAQNAAAFMAGTVIAFLVPLAVFGSFGEAGNMLYCTFVFGFVYGTEGFGFGAGTLFLLTLALPLSALFVSGEKNKRLWLLWGVYTAGMCVTLGMGSSTLHDYMLLAPGVMAGVWQLDRHWRKKKLQGKRGLLAAAVLLVCFAYPLYKLPQAAGEMARQAFDHTVWEHAAETAAHIPQEQRDRVWGYEVPMRWYTMTDIMPCNKYCGWQEHYMELVPTIEEEIGRMMEEEPPEWIVAKTGASLENPMMRCHLQADYVVVCENQDFTLYERRNRG